VAGRREKAREITHTERRRGFLSIVRLSGFALLVVLLLGVALTVTTSGGSGPLPLNTTGSSTGEGRVQSVVEVLRRGYMLSIQAQITPLNAPRLTFWESNRTTNEGTLTICFPTRMCLCLMRTRAWWTDLARLEIKASRFHLSIPPSLRDPSCYLIPTHPLLKTWVCNLLSKKSSTLRAKT
jgi:hypothetical protein